MFTFTLLHQTMESAIIKHQAPELTVPTALKRKQLLCARIRREEEVRREVEQRNDDGDACRDDEACLGTSSAGIAQKSRGKRAAERRKDSRRLQQLKEEAKDLMVIIMKKNEDLKNLRCQLKIAVETNNDLKVSQEEQKHHYEYEIRARTFEMAVLKQEKKNFLEARSEKEKELMNEILKVALYLKELELKHQAALDQIEDLHRIELAEKDIEIAQLKREFCRLKIV